MDSLRHLLDKRWIDMEEDSVRYFSIKDDFESLETLFREKLGVPLIHTHNLIKLEKFTDAPKPWMGIQAFKSKEEYIFLCLILAFLENFEAADKFTLSQITEFIRSSYKYEDLDWTLYRNRQRLIRVLQFMVEERIVVITDMSGSGFQEDMNTEILYENTGFSKYMLRSLNRDIQTQGDLYEVKPEDGNEYSRIARRQRVYRKLLIEPMVYRRDDEADFLYIKNYHSVIEKDLSEHIPCRIMVHKSLAYLLLDEECNMGRTLSDSSNCSEIILLICYEIRERVEELELIPDEEDYISVNRVQFFRMLVEVHSKYHPGFTKQYREQSPSKFAEEMIEVLFSIDFVGEGATDYEYVIKPVMGRLSGAFPESFSVGGE